MVDKALGYKKAKEEEKEKKKTTIVILQIQYACDTLCNNFMQLKKIKVIVVEIGMRT